MFSEGLERKNWPEMGYALKRIILNKKESHVGSAKKKLRNISQKNEEFVFTKKEKNQKVSNS